MMTNDAKMFFDKCRRLERRINGMCDESARLRELACRITPSYSDEPRGGAAQDSRVESAVIKLVVLEQEINAAIDELVEQRRQARWVLENIADTRYVDLLTWRYFSLWNWDKITAALGLEDRTQAWRLHGRALLAANQVLGGINQM